MYKYINFIARKLNVTKTMSSGVKKQTMSPQMMYVIPMSMKLCKFNVSKINVNEN
jgi:hypothetical protein